MDAEGGLSWTYANNLRVATMFLGLSMVSLGIGVLLVLSYGADATDAALTFLTIGIFLAVFAVLVFLPRLVRRGAISFSLYADRPLDEAERVVREALSQDGATVRVEVVRSRSDRPPRIVVADGMAPRFRIESSRSPEAPADARSWTEVIQSGMADEEDEEARRLRDRVAARLHGERPPTN